MILIFVLFLIYALFDNIQSSHLYRVMTTDRWSLAPIEKKIWLDQPQALAAIGFGLAARVYGIVFLIYLGIQTRWYYPILLYVVALPLVVFLQNVVRMKWGVLFPTLLGFIVLPLIGVWMWLSV